MGAILAVIAIPLLSFWNDLIFCRAPPHPRQPPHKNLATEQHFSVCIAMTGFLFYRAPPPPPLNASQLQTNLTVAGMQGDAANSTTTFQRTVFQEVVGLQLAFSYQGQPVAVGTAGFNASSLQVLTRPAALPISIALQVRETDLPQKIQILGEFTTPATSGGLESVSLSVAVLIGSTMYNSLFGLCLAFPQGKVSRAPYGGQA